MRNRIIFVMAFMILASVTFVMAIDAPHTGQDGTAPHSAQDGIIPHSGQDGEVSGIEPHHPNEGDLCILVEFDGGYEFATTSDRDVKSVSNDDFSGISNNIEDLSLCIGPGEFCHAGQTYCDDSSGVARTITCDDGTWGNWQTCNRGLSCGEVEAHGNC